MYLLFADNQAAYDTADRNAMLPAAFYAGVLGTDFLLLYDFLRMDSAVLSFDGIVSIAMSFEAGIPQGIRFVVHIFTVFMTLLQQIFTAVCQPSRTVLPTKPSQRMPFQDCGSRSRLFPNSVACSPCTKAQQLRPDSNLCFSRM